jgi:hypothetical protein
MGFNISKQQKTEKELAFHIRKQNCKISKRIYKILEKAYQSNYLTEFEFHSTIGWYHGLKFRNLTREEEIFITALDKINELVCNLIQEKYAVQLQDKDEQHPLLIPMVPLEDGINDRMADAFKRMLDVNIEPDTVKRAGHGS